MPEPKKKPITSENALATSEPSSPLPEQQAFHLAEGLTQMFVAGVSTRHPWEKSPKPCWESLEVASAISRLNQSLSHQFDTWRQRKLPEH